MTWSWTWTWTWTWSWSWSWTWIQSISAHLRKRAGESLLFLSILLLLSPSARPALGVGPPGQIEGGESQADLQKIERRIEEKKKEIKGLAREEGSVLAAMGELDAWIRELAEARTGLETDVHDLEAEVADLETRTAELVGLRDGYRRQVDTRLVALYKAARTGPEDALLEGHAPAEIARALAYLEHLFAYDAEILGRYRRALDRTTIEEERIEKARISLEFRRIDLRAKAKSLASEKKRKAEMLSGIQDEKESRMRLVSELESSARELASLVASLGRPPVEPRTDETSKDLAPPPAGPPFAGRRGKLSFPVEGTIVSGFGRVLDPKYQTLTFHQGITIAAPLDEEVRCVHAGKVAYAGTFPGYGNLLIVDHGEGFFTVYAHLGDLLKTAGEAVGEAEVVGRVGETGSASRPCLYFEVRRRGVAVDPLQWLAGPKGAPRRPARAGRAGPRG